MKAKTQSKMTKVADDLHRCPLFAGAIFSLIFVLAFPFSEFVGCFDLDVGAPSNVFHGHIVVKQGSSEVSELATDQAKSVKSKNGLGCGVLDVQLDGRLGQGTTTSLIEWP